MGLIAGLILFTAFSLFGAHIIGGEITYVCNGGGSYTFTLKIYRDCAGAGADFDGAPNSPYPLQLTVYQGTSTAVYASVDPGAPFIEDVEPELSNPCLIIPPNVCVEEGTYVFTLNLPYTGESYHLTYQRCCRNNTITNIVNPGDAGATYTMELTPEAQTLCNNSPAFNGSPPIIICAGESIDFDFSATDIDGDDLVYSLCAPFLGGGNNTNQPAIPTGVAPNPDLPPDPSLAGFYPQVNFINPPYSFNNPLNGNPQLAIDPNTGFITGVPNNLGQYVVGVCVEEYRNGVLLSTLRRDFQFNVANCEPTIVADIKEDLLIGDVFRVISCGDSVVTIFNESFQAQFINEIVWSFDLNGTIQTFNTYDVTVEFPGNGDYSGSLVLNPGTTCADTAEIEIGIYPAVEADFDFEYDTCLSAPVIFTDLSVSGAGPNTVVDWLWNFGDGNTRTDQNPEHLYYVPGNLPVNLTVTDINGCQDSLLMNINYYPVPALIVLAPSDYLACQPGRIVFDNLSFPIDETYDIVWDFGDGTFGEGISPIHVYEEPGIYTVSLEITSPIGCFTDTTYNDLIEIRPSPVAGFSYSPLELSNFNPTAYFTDESIDAKTWKWDFGGFGISFDSDPVFTFPDTGYMDVVQIVTHESGCKDTATVRLDIEPQVRYFLPNAFSPNADGTNDFFRGQGVMEGARDFNFQIWNRYGEKIFETNDPYESWNGRKFNTGELAPSGVYLVVVSYIEPRGQTIKINAYATLIH